LQEEIVCQEEFVEGECLVIQRDFLRGGGARPRAAVRRWWRQDSQELLCRRFCDKLPIFFQCIVGEGVPPRYDDPVASQEGHHCDNMKPFLVEMINKL